MKESKYNFTMQLDEDKDILYNTFTKKYCVYKSSDKGKIFNLLARLNCNSFTFSEIDLMKEFISKGIIIKDDLDELQIIRFNENQHRFGDQCFYLTIQPTLDCNFRCVYCYENHRKKVIDNKTEEKILKLINNQTKKVNRMQLGWFGGEPLLELERIISMTRKIKGICKINNCEYSSVMTSNGYLVGDKFMEKFEELSIKYMQITLDGPKECHDKQRPLTNGEGTYDKILSNIVRLLKNNVNIILRINITEKTYKHITQLFDDIPIEYRHNVSLQLSNLMQNKDKISLFEIYMRGIEKGFKLFTDYSAPKCVCEAGFKNSFLIEPDGTVSPCSTVSEDGARFGFINDKGEIVIGDKEFFYKFKNVTAINSEKCKGCIQLPMCLGGCIYARFKDPNVCNGLVPDGLTLKEKIKLHYYVDKMTNNGNEKVSIS